MKYLPSQFVCSQGATYPCLKGHMNNERMNEIDARILGVESETTVYYQDKLRQEPFFGTRWVSGEFVKLKVGA